VQFTAVLGGRDRITEGQLANVVRAAELMALAEEARLTALKGDSAVDLVALVRLEGVADRAVRRLGLDHKREPAETPNLRAYLAGLPKETAGTKRTPAEVPAPSGSPFERVRVGDRVPLDDGREIEVVDDPSDDEAEPAP
jgi:hypothetical protein